VLQPRADAADAGFPRTCSLGDQMLSNEWLAAHADAADAGFPRTCSHGCRMLACVESLASHSLWPSRSSRHR